MKEAEKFTNKGKLNNILLTTNASKKKLKGKFENIWSKLKWEHNIPIFTILMEYHRNTKETTKRIQRDLWITICQWIEKPRRSE